MVYADVATISPVSPRTPEHAYEHSVKSHVLDYWTQRAEDFADLHDKEFVSYKHAAWVAEVGPLLPQTPQGEPLRILDAGTGSGFLALLMAEMSHVASGIDLTPRMIERAQGLLRAGNPGDVRGA